MVLRIALVAVFLIASLGPARAQLSDTSGKPRVMVGGSLGIFRISLEDFTGVYDGRVGLTPGALVAVRVWDPYFLVVAGRTFHRDAKSVGSGNPQGESKWSQRWLNLGVRRIAFGPRVNSYVGFGVALFRAEEDQPSGLLRDDDGSENPTGFFLDFGFDIRIHSRAAAFIAVELSSANIGGVSGFEASSIGGFLFHSGIHFYPF